MHLGTRSLTLTVGGVSRTGDVSDCRIVSGPLSDDHPRRLCVPDREYRLRGRAAQDLSAGSLWDLVWSSVDELVQVDVRPAGGDVASNTQPAFTGTVRISEPDGDILGGGADASPGSRFAFEFDWPFLAKPVRVEDEALIADHALGGWQ